MNRIILLVCMTLFWIFNLKSQDTLYTNDGRLLTGKVFESDESTVRLRPDSAHYGSYIIISKYRIDSIIYSNGEVKSYTSLDRYRIPEVNKDREFFIGIDFLAPISGNARLSVEYRPRTGGTGIFFPLTLNLKKKYDLDNAIPYWFSENSIGLGIKLNYPGRLNAIGYSFGLALIGGNFYYVDYSNYYHREKNVNDNFIELEISNSIQVNIINNLYAGFSIDNVLISFYGVNSNGGFFSKEYRQPTLFPILHLELKIKL